jgi:nucleoside-diphosphate-sugar epimerase
MKDSRSSSKRILVTGASGQIGSELTSELAIRYGTDQIVITDVKPPKDKGTISFQYLDVTDKSSLEKLVKDQDIGVIFHLAGILSATGEMKPDITWSVNTGGLRNVLEVARDRDSARVFWPSSIAVFGPGASKINTPQDSPLVPRTIYGVTKVSGELLCDYYSERYDLDVRSLRYPGIISSQTLPGGGTTDYAVEIFYSAIRDKKYTCFVLKDTVLPMMYMPDCIKATLELMDADPSKISIRTSYNLAGFSFSAEELAEEIRKHIPDFVVDFRPDFRQKIADSWPKSIDDTFARKDWGWKPSYDLASMTEDMIKKLSERES